MPHAPDRGRPCEQEDRWKSRSFECSGQMRRRPECSADGWYQQSCRVVITDNMKVDLQLRWEMVQEPEPQPAQRQESR